MSGRVIYPSFDKNYKLLKNQKLHWIVEYGLLISNIEEEALVVVGDGGVYDEGPTAIGLETYLVQIKVTHQI
jgi:hypothetical protein